MKNTYGISGMTCYACAAAIKRAVERVEGVFGCDVNLVTRKMTVEYDENKTGFLDIKKAVENAGYKISENENTIELIIGGMTCAACSAAVERELNRMPGVKKAAVNLVASKARIEFDKDAVSVSDIKNAVKKAGYRAEDITFDSGADMEEKKKKELKAMKNRVIIAAVFGVLILYLAMGHMLPGVTLPVPAWISSHENPFAFAIAQLLLAIPVMIAGGRFFTSGIRTLFKGSPNMDTLIAIGTGSAFVYGVFAAVMIGLGKHEYVMQLYLESAAVVITLVMTGKYLEALSRGRTSDAVKRLMGLSPKTGIVIRDGKETEVFIDEITTGDIVLVKPGGKIPVDGIVIEGLSAVDESMLTGESMPAEKHAGSEVTGGSINAEGAFKFRVTRVGSETALARIIRLVEEAQSKKAPIARLADTISGYFVPAVIGIALISAAIWLISGKDIAFALTVFVSVLVIACPCALGLATPAAIMAGTGKGAEMGLLFKSGEALETAHKLDTVVLDKTGTITEGKPRLTDIITYGGMEENRALTLCASAEKSSEHPVAKAVAEAALEKSIKTEETAGFTARPGRGIEAEVSELKILAGNKKLMEENKTNIKDAEKNAEKLSKEGKTLLYMAAGGRLAALIAVADTQKPTSPEAVKMLRKEGLRVVMITGDNKNTAEAIAGKTGITEILSEVLPGEKSAKIKELQDGGQRVAMVGDGINDAPALAQADIGIAIGTGTDVAIESADIILMRGDLRDVSKALKLSRATMRNIRQNLFWAFFYNIVGIPFAAGAAYALGGPLLNPMIAGAAMALSSISVVSNALRLKYFKGK